MGYSFKDLFFRTGEAAAAYDPTGMLAGLYYITTPPSNYDINAELNRLKQEYANYMKSILKDAARYQANRSRASMARRGVYAGSAYQPEYQRLQEQNQAYIQQALNQMAMENALRGYNWRQQRYLQEQAGREQMLERASSKPMELLGMITGYATGTSNANYNKILQQSLRNMQQPTLNTSAQIPKIPRPSGNGYFTAQDLASMKLIYNAIREETDIDTRNRMIQMLKESHPDYYYYLFGLQTI
ncbi:MAG: hypothetical protein DRO87_11185 [Candidatus Thorarchaeota archaeon]|nr:MAG: hypothetical protein DRO87_11185 [Candidatus Thorarchaeota archaeon]